MSSSWMPVSVATVAGLGGWDELDDALGLEPLEGSVEIATGVPTSLVWQFATNHPLHIPISQERLLSEIKIKDVIVSEKYNLNLNIS